MRIRDYSENIPKPMIPIGGKPILWHLMSYYSQYGHRISFCVWATKPTPSRNSSSTTSLSSMPTVLSRVREQRRDRWAILSRTGGSR